jgi:hypothetical protein
LMRLALQNQPQPPVPEPRAAAPDELDPDVMALVEPIINRKLAGLEPYLAERRRDEQLAQAEKLMPGFKEQWWPRVQEEFKTLSPDLQKEFDHPVGAVALAGMIQARERKVPPMASEVLKKRAHSEGAPNTQRKTPTLTPDDINRMDPEEFARFKEAQLGGSKISGADRFLR